MGDASLPMCKKDRGKCEVIVTHQSGCVFLTSSVPCWLTCLKEWTAVGTAMHARPSILISSHLSHWRLPRITRCLFGGTFWEANPYQGGNLQQDPSFLCPGWQQTIGRKWEKKQNIYKTICLNASKNNHSRIMSTLQLERNVTRRLWNKWAEWAKYTVKQMMTIYIIICSNFI